MKLQNYILPVFVSANMVAQNDSDPYPSFDFGFTHFVFNSTTFKPMLPNSVFDQESDYDDTPSKIVEQQYGFGIGFFLWMPLNDHVVFRPKIEGTFSNTCFKKISPIYATSFDLSLSHTFAIALKPADEHGTIYVARNMSCYLTSKQPYVLLGPKVNLKKYDDGCIHKGFENELNLGFFVGYGISYEFHGVNFFPEITYGISSTAQNSIDDSKKVTHTLSLAISFF